uniref:Coiled-coil domain containing 32 n=1 Tax=Neogobius melanostomus TaxID=47308 RepID=A0A8C6U578_9GOBI
MIRVYHRFNRDRKHCTIFIGTYHTTVVILTMVDDFEGGDVRSSGELWSEICSNSNSDFSDSFQPGTVQFNGQAHGASTCPSGAKWEPMEDSEIYIASLENRLKRLKGQSSAVTSRDMLQSLSQAKKECWDRFLHDAQTSELFQGGDLDESALEHVKRWLVPEKVAISAEEKPEINPEASEEPLGWKAKVPS